MDISEVPPTSNLPKSSIHPFWDLWIHPKKTIRYLIDTQPKKWILWFSAAAGLAMGAIALAILWNIQASPLTWAWLGIILLVGGILFGIASLYCEAWLYTWTGSWIGGKGHFSDLKCAVGWRNYASIIVLLFNGLSLLSLQNPWVQGLFDLLYLIASIWGFVILIHVVAEAHRFSVWKGLLAVLIALALSLIFFMCIAILIPLLSPLFR